MGASLRYNKEFSAQPGMLPTIGEKSIKPPVAAPTPVVVRTIATWPFSAGKHLVCYDIDGTLAEPTKGKSNLSAYAPVEPIKISAQQWAADANVDMLYLTGRDTAGALATKTWLLNNGLKGHLICRPPTINHDRVPQWKVGVLSTLVVNKGYKSLTMCDNRQDTLLLLKAWWRKNGMDKTCPLKTWNVTPAHQVVEAQIMSQEDLGNFKLLMRRLAPDNEWKKLLLRKWDSKWDLFDAAKGLLCGKQDRRTFTQMIDDLWSK